jgi:type II secretory pathway predicted ATPase ExeA
MNPFDKQLSEKDCFASSDHKNMVSRLNYLKDVKGIGVFTAEPGQGKTFALRCFAKSLDSNLYDMKYIALSTVSTTDFYRQFCTVLSIDPFYRKSDMFRAIQERLYFLLKDRRRPLVLAIDEAHHLNNAILYDLKMIFNHNYDSFNCFTLILVGEPHLNYTLNKPVHEALNQRIVVHHNFEGLSNSEVADYINHKLTIANVSTSIMGEGTLSAIIGYCHGTPRLIDNLMIEVLTLGAQLNRTVVDTELIMASVNNLALV